MMKQALRTIIIVMVVYCAISFIKADYNALKWTQEQRLFGVLLVTLIHILDYLKRETDKIDQ
jgi:hypothetical protein